MAMAIGCCLPACSFSESEPRYDTGLDELDLTAVDPPVLVPGTDLEVAGRSFVDAPWGITDLVLTGRFTSAGQSRDVRVRLPARFVDFEHVTVETEPALVDQLGSADGDFTGTGVIEVASAIDGQVHASRALSLSLSLRTQLDPELIDVGQPSIVFVNDEIDVAGSGMLLGGDEGTTVARVEGCFVTAGGDGTCAPVGPVDVPVIPVSRFDRTHGRFRFAPEIAGIRAGELRGEMRLVNQPAAGGQAESGALDAGTRLTEAKVHGVSPGSVSVGQYLEVTGGGFVGGGDDQVTLLHLTGQLLKAGAPGPIAIDTLLVPEFVSGTSARYVMNEDDDLGQVLGLRAGSGNFDGVMTPIVSFDDEEVTGAGLDVHLRIAPVVQVVYLHFTPQYTSSLQHFGMRAVDALIRRRVLDVVQRDFRTIDIDFRSEPPTDFSLYSEVEIGGPDPNGLGLLGYDNTPGKDVGNLRLYDRIGGVNATTQADGYPGYGGVFVESLFIFSRHPNDLAPESAAADDLFDEIFDPFRPDRDGDAVAGSEAAVIAAPDGSACPGEGRIERIRCAAWVLGSLIGTTVSHELGHSLGLANPTGGDVHILTDQPDRLMEAGGARPFRERAELDGQGPGVFCDQEYAYLRSILPREEPDDPTPRPGCN